ncbi:hypothetical protein HOT94_gp097 [Gordonia phage Phistory]|uniref:Uncharacterized protein n=1 Tax=Gordonia phage Phistory TaxID=2301694 RepID=A0A385E1R1_9CAUD|nr:hypothetical protein HOT94_gp097 [Gordonia phage Phistory]AXQ64802.1 hypothetical protein SEA_PHISTORY_97 [Gordonia phage Phistory]
MSEPTRLDLNDRELRIGTAVDSRTLRVLQQVADAMKFSDIDVAYVDLKDGRAMTIEVHSFQAGDGDV